MDLKSIHEIFTNRILRIPSYQRGFSWSNNKAIDSTSKEPLKNVKGELKDLWDDLFNIQENSWHYTGLLTMVEVKKKDYTWLPNHTQYAIVDGQQRITSILILLSVIIEKAKLLDHILGLRKEDAEIQYLFIDKGAKAYIFGYEKDNPSDKFFRKHILKLDEVEDDSDESVYTENLLKARVFFETMVDLYINNENTDEKTALQKLYNQVTGNLRFNEYILPEELDEYVVFETMNNRGKPLSELEKLKNRLMYLNDKFELVEKEDDNSEESNGKLLNAQKEALSAAINQAWITIYKSLGQNKSRPLNDEDFVKNHWITYFGNYKRNVANVYANYLFDEYFNLQSVYNKSLTIEDTERYVKSLQKCSIWWNKLNNPWFFKTEDLELRRAIEGIHRVGLKTSFKPLLLAILTRKDRNDFITTINTLEKYSFKVFDVSDRQSNTGDSKIFSLAHGVYLNYKNAEETERELINYTKQYYWFDLFKNQCIELFKTGHQQGFYKWSGIHYFLFQYDNYLRTINSTSTKSSELSWKDFHSKNSIEHILPQSATLSLKAYSEQRQKGKTGVKNDYEKIQNNWSAFKEYKPSERKQLANSLGNLLAISSSDNSSFSNDPFLYKVDQGNKGDEYKNRGYQYDSMSAMLIASQNTEWTPDAIVKKGLDMLKYLCKLIGENYNNLSDETKYKVLGLEFMLNKDDTNKLKESTVLNETQL
jgi:uncharacterized protein with ParB-like and HNH nuclease domain